MKEVPVPHLRCESMGAAGTPVDTQAAGAATPSVCSVALHVSGADPKRAKAAYLAHHRARDGRTTLSSSAVLLWDATSKEPRAPGSSSPALALAPLASLLPFIPPSQRSRSSGSADHTPDLLPGTELTLVLDAGTPPAPARLVSVLQLPEAAAVAVSLHRALSQGQDARGWRLGWRLAAEQPQQAGAAEGAGAWALLQAQLPDTWTPAAVAAGGALCRGRDGVGCACLLCGCPLRAGQALRLVGAPFGCLAPAHFTGCVTEACVANTLCASGLDHGTQQSAAGQRSRVPCALFAVDAVAHPGMEGGTLTCRDCGGWVGALCSPLSSSPLQAEVLLAVRAGALLDAASVAGAPDATMWHRSVAQCTWQPPAPSSCHQQHQQLQGQLPCCGCRSCTQAVANDSCGGTRQPCLQRAAARARPITDASARCAVHAHPAPGGGGSGSGAVAAAALAGVVMVRSGGSWASGVVASPGGVVVTNAHLLVPEEEARKQLPPAQASTHAAKQRGAQSGVEVRVSCGGAASRWLPAQVLYVFRGHLDLAVLQVSGLAAPLAPLLLAPPGRPTPGERVYVVGHGLLGPGLQLPASCTRGSAARAVSVPAAAPAGAPRPSMLLTTAAVHAGASGGAVVDSAGRLVGLVTSNARHASGATLPRLNFCVHVEELRPLWAWAAARSAPPAHADHASARTGGESTPLLPAGVVAELARLDVRDDAGVALWALRDPYAPPARAPPPPAQLARLPPRPDHDRIPRCGSGAPKAASKL